METGTFETTVTPVESYYPSFCILFEMANMTTVELENMTVEDLNEAIAKIKKKLSYSQSSRVEHRTEDTSVKKVQYLGNVLVVSELGIVSVQLKRIFGLLNYRVTVVGNFRDALTEFKRRDYDKVIIDFCNNDGEAMVALEDMKSTSIIADIYCQFIVLASPNLQQEATNKGCDWMVMKADGWQDKLFQGLRTGEFND